MTERSYNAQLMQELVDAILDPERLGFAVTPEVRDRARLCIGLAPVEGVAKVVSGYSGDPDTRGKLALQEIDISNCKVGDLLYKAEKDDVLTCYEEYSNG